MTPSLPSQEVTRARVYTCSARNVVTGLDEQATWLIVGSEINRIEVRTLIPFNYIAIYLTSF